MQYLLTDKMAVCDYLRMDDDWLLLTEAAARSGLSPVTLRVQYRNHRLAAQKRGRDLWVRWSEVERYLAARAKSGRYRADVGNSGDDAAPEDPPAGGID